MSKPLPTEVTASTLRDNLAAYLDAAEHGATITITRRGRPSLQLAVVGETPEALDPTDLRTFRASLGVRVEQSAVIAARQDERY